MKSVSVIWPSGASGNARGNWIDEQALWENHGEECPTRFTRSVGDLALRVHFTPNQEGETKFCGHLTGYYEGRPPRITAEIIHNGDTVKTMEVTMVKGRIQTIRWEPLTLDMQKNDELTVRIVNQEPSSVVYLAECALIVVPDMPEIQVPVLSHDESPFSEFRSCIPQTSPVEVEHGKVMLEWQNPTGELVEIHRKFRDGTICVGHTNSYTFKDSVYVPGTYEYWLCIPGKGLHPVPTSITVSTVPQYAKD